jgi:hypothetical protein
LSNIHRQGDRAAATRPDDDFRLVLIEFGLRNANGLQKILTGEGGIEDFVSASR